MEKFYKKLNFSPLDFRKPRIPDLKDDWPAFTKDNSYAVISDTPRYEKKFRFCQVALWGGLVDALKDPFCNLPGINDILNILPKDLLTGGGILNPADVSKKLVQTVLPGKLIPKIPGLSGDGKGNTPLPGFGGLLGNGGDKKSDGKHDLTGGLLGGSFTKTNSESSGEKKNDGKTGLTGGLLGSLTNGGSESKQTTKTPVAHIGLKLPLG